MRADIEVRCEHCQDPFTAQSSLAGGITNCPRCGKATEVEGLRDPLWRLVQALISLAAVAAVGLGISMGEPLYGVLTAALLLGLAWLATRGL